MEVIKKLNNEKAPGHDLIAGQIIKELPGKDLLKLLELINASTDNLNWSTNQWKVREKSDTWNPSMEEEC